MNTGVGCISKIKKSIRKSINQRINACGLRHHQMQNPYTQMEKEKKTEKQTDIPRWPQGLERGSLRMSDKPRRAHAGTRQQKEPYSWAQLTVPTLERLPKGKGEITLSNKLLQLLPGAWNLISLHLILIRTQWLPSKHNDSNVLSHLDLCGDNFQVLTWKEVLPAKARREANTGHSKESERMQLLDKSQVNAEGRYWLSTALL